MKTIVLVSQLQWDSTLYYGLQITCRFSRAIRQKQRLHFQYYRDNQHPDLDTRPLYLPFRDDKRTSLVLVNPLLRFRMHSLLLLFLPLPFCLFVCLFVVALLLMPYYNAFLSLSSTSTLFDSLTSEAHRTSATTKAACRSESLNSNWTGVCRCRKARLLYRQPTKATIAKTVITTASTRMWNLDWTPIFLYSLNVYRICMRSS